MPLDLFCHSASDLDVRADQKMDQRIIVEDVALKELSVRAIHEDLIGTICAMQSHAAHLATSFARDSDLPPSQHTPPGDIRRGADDSDQVLSSALDENRFTPVRHLSWLTDTRRTTVCAGALPIESICSRDWCERVKSSATGDRITWHDLTRYCHSRCLMVLSEYGSRIHRAAPRGKSS
jgi:hypothetical protein